jgi:hypothetical protein
MFVFMMLVYHGDFREPGKASAGRTENGRATVRHASFLSRANRAARPQGIAGVCIETRTK